MNRIVVQRSHLPKSLLPTLLLRYSSDIACKKWPWSRDVFFQYDKPKESMGKRVKDTEDLRHNTLNRINRQSVSVSRDFKNTSRKTHALRLQWCSTSISSWCILWILVVSLSHWMDVRTWRYTDCVSKDEHDSWDMRLLSFDDSRDVLEGLSCQPNSWCLLNKTNCEKTGEPLPAHVSWSFSCKTFLWWDYERREKWKRFPVPMENQVRFSQIHYRKTWSILRLEGKQQDCNQGLWFKSRECQD